MNSFSVENFRQCFPLLGTKINNKPFIYFDNGATSQKPTSVINCFKTYYETMNANVHRASHAISAKATQSFENARLIVRNFIHAQSAQEIIWTKGTTESINLVAQSWGSENLFSGNEILLSYAEHHANIVPWQQIAKQTGATIKVLPLNDSGQIDCSKLDTFITDKTKIICISHISNVIGKINPVKEVIKKAKSVGAKVLLDGAQASAHIKVNVSELDCDFYVFSAHKMYGPTGLGVLYGKKELLEQMSPYQCGGEMIKNVSFTETTFNALPFKFEAGTPNIAGVIAFAEALKFISTYKIENLHSYEKELVVYGYEKLSHINGLRFICEEMPDIPVFSFTIDGHHNHDVAAYLDSLNIAVRSGHHCAMPLMHYLNISGCIRISLAAYNTVEEIDELVHVLSSLNNIEEVQEVHKLVVATDNEADVTSINNQINELDIISIFDKASAWDERHRQIMLLSKRLTKLPAEKRNADHLIDGCESKAWLAVNIDNKGVFSFTADSDAKVIRGLLVIVIAIFNGKSAEEIIDFDIETYFNKLGLLRHLSPSRGNGVKAIVEKAIAYAKAELS